MGSRFRVKKIMVAVILGFVGFQRIANAESIVGEFIKVSGGTFELGCGSWQSDCEDNEKPVQKVTVDDFEIGKYEVTQGQWKAVMGSNPSFFSSCGDDCPVEMVSWDHVQEFIKKLNALERGTYRLPTEVEWEYACRSGGKHEKYCGGNNIDQLMWYGGNSGGMTHPVGKKHPNGLDIHDMSGNVFEWTCSGWGNYNDGEENHTKCIQEIYSFTLRGGAWDNHQVRLRSSFRYPDLGDRYNVVGFRLVRIKSK